MSTTPMGGGAPPIRRVVVLPVDITILKDGGRYDPAETVADSRTALGVTHAALVASLRSHGYEAVSELGWSGRLVHPDGTFGAPVTDAAGVVGLEGAFLSGTAPDRDLLERVRAETDADAIVLVSAHGTRLSGEKLAGQIAAGTAIGVVAVGAVVIVAAAAVAGGKLDGLGKVSVGGGGGGGAGALRVAGSLAELGVRAALLPLRLAPHALFLDTALYVPVGHVDGPACAPAYGIHDGVAPVPRERPDTGFWSGARLDLSLTFAWLPEGNIAWSGNTERHANALRPDHMQRVFGLLLEHGPPAR
jgi:hypothetical protein